jgi:hypothetical protein
LLELLYALKRFSIITVEVQLKHGRYHHGIRAGERTVRECKLEDVPDLMTIGQQYCDLLDKYITFAAGTIRGLLEAVGEGWDTLYVFKEHFGKSVLEKHGVDEDQYCPLGAGAACLELMIQGPAFHLGRILNQPFLER